MLVAIFSYIHVESTCIYEKVYSIRSNCLVLGRILEFPGVRHEVV